MTQNFMNKIFVSKIIEYSPQSQQDNPTPFPLLQALIAVKAVADVCSWSTMHRAGLTELVLVAGSASQSKLSTLCSSPFLRSSSGGCSW